jgi:hypothetical protein
MPETHCPTYVTYVKGSHLLCMSHVPCSANTHGPLFHFCHRCQSNLIEPACFVQAPAAALPARWHCFHQRTKFTLSTTVFPQATTLANCSTRPRLKLAELPPANRPMDSSSARPHLSAIAASAMESERCDTGVFPLLSTYLQTPTDVQRFKGSDGAVASSALCTPRPSTALLQQVLRQAPSETFRGSARSSYRRFVQRPLQSPRATLQPGCAAVSADA